MFKKIEHKIFISWIGEKSPQSFYHSSTKQKLLNCIPINCYKNKNIYYYIIYIFI